MILTVVVACTAMDSEWSYLVVTVVESMPLVELVFVEGFQISASSPTDKTRYSIRQSPTYASGVRPKYVEGYLTKIQFNISNGQNSIMWAPVRFGR